MGLQDHHNDYRFFRHAVTRYCYICDIETENDEWETLDGRKAKKCRVCGFVTFEQMQSMW